MLEVNQLIGFGAINSAVAPFIVSITPWTIDITSGNTTGTATIPAGSLVSSHLSGQTSDNGATDGRMDRAHITRSGATLTATRTGTTGNLKIVGFSIEWDPAFMKSVTYGTAQITTTNTTGDSSAFSAVVLANSAIQHLGYSSSIAGGSGQNETGIYLNSTTVARAERDASTSATITTGFCVMEFQAGVLNSNTQALHPKQTTSQLFAEAAVSPSVTMAQTWLVYGGRSSSNVGYNGGILPAVRLKDASTVREQTNSAVATSQAWVTVVEFKAAQVNLVQRGNANPIIDASNAFVDVTLSPAMPDVNKAVVNWLGEEQTTGSSAVANVCMTRGALTTAANLRLSKNTASATVQPSMSWEAIPFNY